MNDLDYLGRINVCSGPIAWVDIPGVAKVEFSLLPLTDGVAEGVLNDGTLNIVHDNKTSIRITNVLNGVERSILQGGPYRVWVRWLKPSQTVEEYEASLKKQLVTLKNLVKNGDIEVPEITIELLERAAKSGRIQVSCGVRAPRPGEVLGKP